MRTHLLFVDTETSGIPTSLNASVTDMKDWPYIVQLAWRVYTQEGELIKTENHFLFEEEIYIEKSSYQVHGISREDLKEKGEDRKDVMRLFASDLRRFKPMIIGHFVEFDSKMLQVAMLRSGLKNIVKDYPHFCTMRATSEYTRIPNHTYPKLADLYQMLFSKKIAKAHDAAVDVEATAACFYDLYKWGDLNEQLISNQPLFIKVKDQVRSKMGCGLPVLIFLFISFIWIFI